MIKFLENESIAPIAQEDYNKFMKLYNACMDSLNQLREFAKGFLSADDLSNLNAAAVFIREAQRSLSL